MAEQIPLPGLGGAKLTSSYAPGASSSTYQLLSGKVTRTIMANAGFNVYAVRSAACGEVRVISKTPLASGDEVDVVGYWTKHASYGTQFQAVDRGAAQRQLGKYVDTATLVQPKPLLLATQLASFASPAAPLATAAAPPAALAPPPPQAAAAFAPAAAVQPAPRAPPPPMAAVTPAFAPPPPPPLSRAAAETVTGTISHITFRSTDGFTIARLVLEASALARAQSGGDYELGPRKRGRSKTVIVRAADALALSAVGERVALTGSWLTHPKFGRQFDALARARTPEPTCAEDVLVVLGNGAIKGIGPVIAKRIVDTLGDDAVLLLRNDARARERLRTEVKGVGDATFKRIVRSLDEHAQTESLVAFFKTLQLPIGAALRLHKRFGGEAEARVRADPYVLIDELADVGFSRADLVAKLLGLPLDAGCRLEAALREALQLAASSGGHVYLPANVLVADARARLAVPAESFLPARSALAEALGALVARGELRAERVHTQTTSAVSAAELRALVFAEPAAGGAGGHRDDLAAALAAAEAERQPAAREPAREGAADDAPVQLGAAEVAVYLPSHYDDELTLARAVRARLSELQRGSGWVRADPSAEELADLTEEQRRAVELATSGKRLVVLTGGPGTGKTRTVETIVRLWQRAGKKVELACPTARGAAVLTELTGLQARTVHRLLQFQPRDAVFTRDADNTLDADAIVVDEASMLDATLAAGLLDALPLRCTLLLVGDADQLPSVGPGQVLRDILSCAAVERVQLRQVFRFEGSGEIALNAAQINRGRMLTHLEYLLPEEAVAAASGGGAGDAAARGAAPAATGFAQSELRGCKLVMARTAAEASATISGTVLDWLEGAGYCLHTDLQVLSPTKLGPAGSHALNRQLQARLNPEARRFFARRDAAAATGRTSAADGPPPAVFVGDRVIQLRNDYDNNVFNGDVGTVTRADGPSRKFTVEFHGAPNADGAPRALEYGFHDLDREISLAYALTVHKAQGSEFPVVVVPALHEHASFLYRNLLYTAVSRAKQLLVVVGSQGALERCVAEDSRVRRLTRLTHLISTDTTATYEIDVDMLRIPGALAPSPAAPVPARFFDMESASASSSGSESEFRR